jgi:uncharacterized protein
MVLKMGHERKQGSGMPNPSLKIVIAGGSGSVGSILARHFHANRHSVTILSRYPKPAAWQVMTWDGQNPGEWVKGLEGCDVCINLTGRSVNCRYTPENRREIYHSRIDSTRVLGDVIGSLRHPPRLWLNASTATIYRHVLDRPQDEIRGEIGGEEPNVPETWRFSIQVAKDWETTFFAAPTSACRKIALRSAITLSPDRRGAFAVLSNLVRFGAGGKQGLGNQYVSWIHAADFARAIDHLIVKDSLDGAINICSPNPLPNEEFMRGLRAAWRMRFGVPARRWMIELGSLILRTESELVLKSRQVVPTRLIESGFRFRFPECCVAAQDLVRQWR